MESREPCRKRIILPSQLAAHTQSKSKTCQLVEHID